MTIDKTINEVKDLQEKDSLTLNEIDNNVKKILKFGTGGAVDLSGVTTEIQNNTTKLNTIENSVETNSEKLDGIDTRICSVDDKLNENTTKISEIDTKIDEINTDLDEITIKSNTISNKVTSISNDVSESGTKIENIDEKIDSLLYYFSETPKPIEFDEDPFKLNQTFTGYTSDATFNTEDSLEVTKSYVLNEKSRNSYFYITYLSVYCESETFDLKFDVDLDISGAGYSLVVEAHDSTIGTTESYSASFPLSAGNNKKTILVEGIKTLSGGNYVSVKVGNHSATVNNFKVTLMGKNIKIINKPMKYKVFHKFDTVIISKLENNNAYTMTFDSTNMNPADLTRRYKLKVQNVRDYDEILSTFYADKNYPLKAFRVVAYLDLDGVMYNQVENAMMKNPPGAYSSDCFKLLDLAGGSSFGHVLYNVRYNTKPVMQGFVSVTTSHTGSASTYAFTKGMTANIAPIYKKVAEKDSINVEFIMTNIDCTNYIWFALTSTGNANKVNIGKGYNVTAYFDKNDETKVNVYMKLGDKMIRKVLRISTITDDDGNEIKTADILEEKIIGTYDYYFETQTDVYFVVKNDQLYMFKNETTD